MAAEAKRIEIGFDGGQVISVRLTDERVDELRKAVGGPDAGWHDLETADGTLALDLAKVSFVRGSGGGASIGFSGS
ncbi:hypothetical protein HJD18_00760 [Thermoleophilia bacterium SCSIO 60948]|nr:hypothetical protein HJD18_00760 [Thermoleophilia bacterium SCSIO 60948]